MFKNEYCVCDIVVIALGNFTVRKSDLKTVLQSVNYNFNFFFVFPPGNSYNTEERCVCSGYDNGDVKLFDLKTMSLRWETNIKNGVSFLICKYIY